ncbi:DUF583 domain-containing protein [Shewanella sp. NFH-SH190041]|uniref:bactofilin family protein n=1 Tax=Shewanella sp. NFH-SH190041 TaxID=2950245 RepID=UPI0021C2B66C|nr:polymer-forming cytoskeletal protein [Shewanella sp. NFH-SH190041]BDM65187.1 DUF583 domain-containing protein [Shewanella sp. NFH-SH190041]
MFGKKKSITGLTYIAQGTRVTGESHFAGDALVGGEIHGTIQSEGTVTIEPSGLISGDIECQEIKVSGLLQGKLRCERLVITGTGTVEGDVSSNHMEIFEGGQFIGVRVKDKHIDRLEQQAVVDDKKLQKIMELDDKKIKKAQ